VENLHFKQVNKSCGGMDMNLPHSISGSTKHIDDGNGIKERFSSQDISATYRFNKQEKISSSQDC
jgi:hypothetical protein